MRPPVFIWWKSLTLDAVNQEIDFNKYLCSEVREAKILKMNEKKLVQLSHLINFGLKYLRKLIVLVHAKNLVLKSFIVTFSHNFQVKLVLTGEIVV